MSNGPKIVYEAIIADAATAIQRSGKNSGGGRIMYDVAEDQMGALAAHIPLAQTLLRVTVEVMSLKPARVEDSCEEERSEKPQWARQH